VSFNFPMQGISCADVADICVKALHDSTARNKSFDVRFVLLLSFMYGNDFPTDDNLRLSMVNLLLCTQLGML